MKWVPISLALAVHSIGFFGAIKAQAPQSKSIKQLFKERDLDALAWRFQQNTPNIDEASIGNQTPLVAACSKLDVGMVGFLLNKIQNANPNLFNPLGVTLRAIIDLHKHTEPDKTPPTTIEIPEFPQAKAIEEILDTLIKSGANPLTHKLENIQLLNELTKAFQSTSYIATKNPIIISMRKLLPMFLTYEVGYPFDPSTPKGKRVYGDIRLVTTYLESINNLYNKYPNTDGFDPLNTPLINNGEGFLGKTPVQLAAENGHTDRLTAMLALKDNLGHTRVSFVTAYNASKHASSEKTGFILWKRKSCKEILQDFLRTHFIFNKAHNEYIIQLAQSTIARKAWQQTPLETETYDNAIVQAINTRTEPRITKD